MSIEEREQYEAINERRKLALVSADKQLLPVLYPEVLKEQPKEEVELDEVPDGAAAEYQLVAPEGFSEDEYDRLMAELEDQSVTVVGDDGGGEWQ